MQDLEFESKKIRIENTRVKFGKFFTKLCFIYFLYSLSAFIIPKNILDISPVCLNFVNFMKSYFPNIEIIGSISPYTQLSEFYVSIMWIYGIIIFAVSSLYSLVYYIYFCRYDDDFILVAKKKRENDCPFLLLPFMFGLGIFMFWVYYTGYFASSGISIRTSHFMPEFQSRFSIFGYIFFFQSGFSLSSSIILMSTFEFIYKIYFYLKGVKDAEQSQ